MAHTQDASVALATLIARLQREPARRFILGIAGVGGSGKSTLAAQLVAQATAAGVSTILLPMDGFHLPNAELERRSIRHLKGKPITFDAAGYIDLLERVKADREAVTFPIYDRQLHDPVWPGDEAHTVQPGPQHRLVIAEGNYLLLNDAPWSRIASVLNEAWLLDVPVELARDRIIARHIRGGRSEADARAHYERVDGPNAAMILTQSRPPDRFVVSTAI